MAPEHAQTELSDDMLERILDGVATASSHARTVLFVLLALCLFMLVTVSGFLNKYEMHRTVTQSFTEAKDYRVLCERKLDKALRTEVAANKVARAREKLRQAERDEARWIELAQQKGLQFDESGLTSVPVLGVQLWSSQVFLLMPFVLFALYAYLQLTLSHIRRSTHALLTSLTSVPAALRPMATFPWVGAYANTTTQGRVAAWLSIDLAAPVTLIILGVVFNQLYPLGGDELAFRQTISWTVYGLSALAAIAVAAAASWTRWRPGAHALVFDSES